MQNGNQPGDIWFCCSLPLSTSIVSSIAAVCPQLHWSAYVLVGFGFVVSANAMPMQCNANANANAMQCNANANAMQMQNGNQPGDIWFLLLSTH